MIDFENLLDEIRIKLYEETKGMGKEDIIDRVNAHALKIAQEFGLNVETLAPVSPAVTAEIYT